MYLDETALGSRAIVPLTTLQHARGELIREIHISDDLRLAHF
jgi:hypothetical protein